MASKSRLPALAHVQYRRYLIGSFVSNVGNTLQAAAIALHVYTLTGSSLMVGLLGLVRVGPLLVFSLLGGIVADHHDRRKVMMATQGGMALIALALVLMQAFNVESVGLIYLLVALAAIARAFDGPARQAMVANLVPPRDLPNAIGLNGISWRLSDVLGPLLVGAVVLTQGVPALGPFGTSYLINLVSYGAVFWSLWLLPPKPPEGISGDRPQNLRQLIEGIKDGLKFVHQTPVLRSTMWIDFWATFFSSADALLPAFAKDVLKVGDAGFGVLQASIGVGALLGAVVMTWLPTIRHQGRWVIAMVGLYGVFTVLFGFSSNVGLAVFFLAGTGFADMVSTVLRQTIRQLATPDSLRGRMSATSMLFNITGPQLGDFEAGAVSALTGERWSVALGGMASTLIAAYWSRSALRRYEHPIGDASGAVQQPS